MNDNRVFKKPYKPRRASRKDYDHFKTHGLATAPLPHQLIFTSPILDQGSKPSCTAYAAVAIRESMKGKQYDPDAQWQEELNFMGVQSADGAELKTQLAVGVKVGFFPIGEPAPTDRASAYFFINKPFGMDWFDAVRTTINQIQAPLTIGMNWYSDWDHTPNGIIPDSATRLLGGHDVKVAGFETYNLDGQDYILLQNSWGTAYGDNGIFRVPRNVFNKYFTGYGAGYWSDNPDDKFKQYGFLAALLQNLVALYQTLINRQSVDPTPPAPAPAPESMQDMVRRVANEEALSPILQNQLFKTIQCESGFNPKTVHPNNDAKGNVLSTDYGICQFNDFYWIGQGKPIPSVDFALNEPEQCVRIMARAFRDGLAHQWVCWQKLFGNK